MSPHLPPNPPFPVICSPLLHQYTSIKTLTLCPSHTPPPPHTRRHKPTAHTLHTTLHTHSTHTAQIQHKPAAHTHTHTHTHKPHYTHKYKQMQTNADTHEYIHTHISFHRTPAQCTPAHSTCHSIPLHPTPSHSIPSHPIPSPPGGITHKGHRTVVKIGEY